MSQKEAASRREQDTYAWQRWKDETDKTGNEANQFWGPLMKRMKPAQDAFLRQYGGKTDMPESAIRAHSFKGVVEGVRTWDPKHEGGAALFTHVTNKVRDGSRRYVQQGQNAGHRTPEHRAYSARAEYEAALSDFEATHGYEPNDSQLADFLLEDKTRYPSITKNMTKKNRVAHVERFSMDLNLSAPGVGGAIQENVSLKIPKEDTAVQELKYQLNTGMAADQQKAQVLDLLLSGKSGAQIARKLSIGESKVSLIRRELVQRLNKELSRRR